MDLKKLSVYLLGFIIVIFVACSSSDSPKNDQSPTFDASKSDQKAIDIADKVIEAMGGQKNWDAARYINWDFFDARKLYWDKWTGNVRIESSRDNFTVLVNIHDLTGKVMKNHQEITNSDTLANFLEIGKSMWINDSYWLVMPFKLKDPGVILKYIGQDTTSEGSRAEVIQLTFDAVGETPQNKYDIYVDPETNLVSEWAFYKNTTDKIPEFRTPWKHYKWYGNILLSYYRGEGYFLSDIEVLDKMPESIFTEF